MERDRKKYQAEYYRKNRRRLLAYRKWKYRNNNNYRNRVKATASLDMRIYGIGKGKTDSNGRPLFSLYTLKNRTPTSLYDYKTLGIIPKAAGYTYDQIMLMDHLFHLIDDCGVKLTHGKMIGILRLFWNEEFNKEEIERYAKDVGYTQVP